jgi:hypothetical protein
VRRLAITTILVGVALTAGCPRTRPTPVSSLPTPAAQTTDSTGPSEPIAAWFGTWHEESSRFARTQKIDKVEGVTFGWRIKTHCTGPVKFREVMHLPSPGDWSFEPAELPGTIISDDQTTTTTTDYAACKQGWVEHRWTIAANDPAGTYVITVELDGYAPTTFRPQFVSPP